MAFLLRHLYGICWLLRWGGGSLPCVVRACSLRQLSAVCGQNRRQTTTNGPTPTTHYWPTALLSSYFFFRLLLLLFPLQVQFAVETSLRRIPPVTPPSHQTTRGAQLSSVAPSLAVSADAQRCTGVRPSSIDTSRTTLEPPPDYARTRNSAGPPAMHPACVVTAPRLLDDFLDLARGCPGREPPMARGGCHGRLSHQQPYILGYKTI